MRRESLGCKEPSSDQMSSESRLHQRKKMPSEYPSFGGDLPSSCSNEVPVCGEHRCTSLLRSFKDGSAIEQ